MGEDAVAVQGDDAHVHEGERGWPRGGVGVARRRPGRDQKRQARDDVKDQ
jgi:hypothetical protein